MSLSPVARSPLVPSPRSPLVRVTTNIGSGPAPADNDLDTEGGTAIQTEGATDIETEGA